MWDVELEYSSTLTFIILKSSQNNGSGIYVGIATSQHDIKESIGGTSESWAFGPTNKDKVHDGSWDDYATIDSACTDSTTVTLHVDKAKGKMRVTLNGINLGPMFTDDKIKTERVYPAVSMVADGDKVGLTDVQVME